MQAIKWDICSTDRYSGFQKCLKNFHELSVLDHSVVCAHAQESCMQFFIVKTVSH